MIVDRIQLYLNDKEKTVDEAIRYDIEKISGATFKRQFMVEKEDSKDLRMSSAGKCARALAYKFHGFEPKGKEIDARARIVFWTGDLSELTVVSLAKIAGANVVATGLAQTKCSLKIGDREIFGHPDGIVLDSETRKFLLLEVKSMSSFTFERFEKGEIDHGYLCQIHLYMRALGLEKCVLVALNKDSGVLSEKILDFDPVIADWAEDNLKTVLTSTPETLPQRPYEPDKKGALVWQCNFCSFWGHCWPAAEKIVKDKSYKLVVKSGALSANVDTH